MARHDTLSYCGQQVRRFDHDRYLTALFAPADRREALFALYAFNLEVAKTREVVTEPLLGQIRLQWWRDSVDAAYRGEAPKHEVLIPLAEAVAAFGLTKAHFERLIEAREADLEETAPPDLAALEAYAEGTAAPLQLLALEALGVRDADTAEAARRVAVATALTGLLRAVPFHARQRRVYLPTAVVEDVAVELGDLFELRPHVGLAKAVERLAGRARAVLGDARALQASVPRPALPALLPAVLASHYLEAMRRAAHDVFDGRVQRRPPWAAWSLAWHAARGRY
jgi:phytoene synthase